MNPMSDQRVIDGQAKLTELARTIQYEEDAVKAARHVREQERAAERRAPPKPILTRIKEWFFPPKPTAAQIALSDAEGRLNVAKMAGLNASKQWVSLSANQRMAGNPIDTQQHQSLQKLITISKQRKDKISRLLGLANTARSRFVSAKRDCESASSMEMFDMFSTNKGISMLSTMETSDAADSLKGAQRALRELKEAMPKRVKQDGIDVPDDWFDLAFDLIFDPIFDYFSWSNMGKLDNAASKCQDVIDGLAPLLDKLNETVKCLDTQIKNDTAAMLAIEKPYVEAAMAELPSTLHECYR